MNISEIKALTFDTGGTILDWHRGFKTAFETAGTRYGLDRDWSELTNELRRRSMQRMLNAGATEPPTENMDEVHRAVLDELLVEAGLNRFDDDDRHRIAYQAPHSFSVWTGFPETLSSLRNHYLVASFSILSYRMIIDTSKHNGLSWDAVFSCEGLGKYKLLPESYLAVAEHLQLKPEECCMVACHHYDLDAARAAGFRTAYLHRPEEWGTCQTEISSEISSAHDIVARSHEELVQALLTGK